MRVPPWKSLGMCLRGTNKGKSGFGKASDKAKAKDHRPSGILGEVWWGALSAEGRNFAARPLFVGHYRVPWAKPTHNQTNYR